jgi:hypothetical protein
MHSSCPLWLVCGPIAANRGWRGPTGIPHSPADLRVSVGAGEGNRTLMTSLEGWGSAIELRPRGQSRDASAATGSHRVSYRPFP